MSWIACRAAEDKDVATVRAVLVETWHATYDRLYGAARVTEITDSWHSIDRLAAQIAQSRSDQSVVMVGLWDGRIVATASAHIAAQRSIKIDRLYVRGSYQGLGIGIALLNATVGALPRASSLRLEVDPGNTDAIEFYKRLGFVGVGESNDCGKSGFGIRARIFERETGRDTGVI
jgi:ribosomal protein S18 acetylase RimI-like enzyme